MEESHGPGLDRFARWLFSPRVKLVCFVIFTGLLVLDVWSDERTRSRGDKSVLAPTRNGIWLGIGLGGALGAVGLVTELIRRARGRIALAGEPSTGDERVAWRQFRDWFLNEDGWRIALLFAAIIWCVCVHVTPYLPMVTAFVASYPGYRLLDLLYGRVDPWRSDAEPGQ